MRMRFMLLRVLGLNRATATSTNRQAKIGLDIRLHQSLRTLLRERLIDPHNGSFAAEEADWASLCSVSSLFHKIHH